MYLWLYRSNIDKRYLNKPEVNNDVDTGILLLSYMNCKLLDNTSFIDPVFTVSYNSAWWSANYCFCEDTDRWYFINDIEYSQNKMYLHCHVDVLQTYRNQLKDKVALIKRASSDQIYNKWLEDDKYKCYKMPAIRTLAFGAPSIRGFYNSTNDSKFVLGIVGRNPDQQPEEEES